MKASQDPVLVETMWDGQFSPHEYDKKKFSFSGEEQKAMFVLEVGQAVIDVLFENPLSSLPDESKKKTKERWSQVVTGYLVQEVLPRLGLRKSLEIPILYDTVTKTLTVYNPKHWCTKCDKFRGTESIGKGAFLCKSCYSEENGIEPIGKLTPEERSERESKKSTVSEDKGTDPVIVESPESSGDGSSPKSPDHSTTDGKLP